MRRTDKDALTTADLEQGEKNASHIYRCYLRKLKIVA